MDGLAFRSPMIYRLRFPLGQATLSGSISHFYLHLLCPRHSVMNDKLPETFADIIRSTHALESIDLLGTEPILKHTASKRYLLPRVKSKGSYIVC